MQYSRDINSINYPHEFVHSIMLHTYHVAYVSCCIRINVIYEKKKVFKVALLYEKSEFYN